MGPIVKIMPWNFPFWLPLKCGIPTLLAGNTIILKGAPNTPQCSLALENIFRESGFDNFEFQNIFMGNNLTKRLISNKKIRGVSFTGSSKAAKVIMEYCAGNYKKIVTELGGSDPFIVLEDADIEYAVQ